MPTPQHTNGSTNDSDEIRLEEDAAPPRQSTPPRQQPLPSPRTASAGATPKPLKPASKPGANQTCPNCRYDIRNLPIGNRCPECGTDLIKAITSARRAAGTRQQLKAEYRSAIITWVLSWAALAGLLVASGNVADFPWFLAKYAIFVPIGFAAFYACSAMWIGFDQPLGITLIRLAAIYAIGDAVGLGMFYVPILFIGPIVVSLVMLGLMTKWLEIDFQDAIVMSFITGAIRVIVYLGLASIWP